MTDVELNSLVRKQLKKLPRYIRKKLLAWAKAVKRDGIYQIRKMKGYHDEPLRGKRLGQRSIRLSLNYRAIYRETKNGIHLITVEEVHKHDY